MASSALVDAAPPADPLRALFDQARNGDRAALDALCRAMRPRLYRTAWAVLRDGDEADDVAQEALVKAVTRTFLFLGRGSVGGWMTRIALNLAKNRIRDRRRRGEILDASGEGERTARGAQAGGQQAADAVLADKETHARLLSALALLPERQREVVQLRVVADLSFADVGTALGITEANARVTFSQAKKRLLDAVSSSSSAATAGVNPVAHAAAPASTTGTERAPRSGGKP
jgi:RNA polymerase sigma-70 factor (ECF subfamily)